MKRAGYYAGVVSASFLHSLTWKKPDPTHKPSGCPLPKLYSKYGKSALEEPGMYVAEEYWACLAFKSARSSTLTGGCGAPTTPARGMTSNLIKPCLKALDTLRT